MNTPNNIAGWVRELGELFYDDTPCDSPIEDIFYYEFWKVRAEGSKISRQFECPTSIGTFRLDFLVEVQGRRIGFECDGREFHNDRHRDKTRDKAIVIAGHADCIYRLRGHDIFCHPAMAFDIIRERDPLLFSAHGNMAIESLLIHCHKTSGYRRNWHEDRMFINDDEVDRFIMYDTQGGDEEISDRVIVTWTGKPQIAPSQ